MGAVLELTELLFVHAFANVTAVRAEGGLVLIDTGNYRARDKTFAAVRGWDDRPLAAAVYTHGHVDHACGLPPFLTEAAARGRPRPRIVGHRDVARRFDRYRATAPWNGLINARQFSIAASWPTEYDYPDTIYDATHRLEIGDLALELTHARGETDDATWVWWPARRVLFTGDLFFWVAPNAGNPQKVQRYAGEWAVALRAMAERAAEVLVPGHGVPIVGAGRVRQALEDTAEWLETLERETVARMNAGATLEQILAEVPPPRTSPTGRICRPCTTSRSSSCGTCGGSTAAGGTGSRRTSSRRRRRLWGARWPRSRAELPRSSRGRARWPRREIWHSPVT